VEDVLSPPAATPTALVVQTEPIAPLPPSEPAKKRGFWSRVFGKRQDDKKH
jgi:hypothetical protein